MRKSAKTTWRFFPMVQLPTRTQPSSHLLSHIQTTCRLSEKCNSNLCVSEKSVRAEQTWYFPSWLCKVKYLTLRISMFLTKVEIPPSTAAEFYHPSPQDGEPRLQWTVSQPEDLWVISLALEILLFSILLSQVVIPSRSTLFFWFGCIGVWLYLVAFLLF